MNETEHELLPFEETFPENGPEETAQNAPEDAQAAEASVNTDPGDGADERRSSLEAREKALDLRELKLDAEQEMQKRGLPAELVKTLPMEDREKCFSALDTLEKAFRGAVRQAVEEKLKAGVPAAAPAGDSRRYALMLRKALGLK